MTISMDRVRRVQVVRDSLPKIARMLSGKNIELFQRGSKAYVEYDDNAEPKRVVVPVIPDDASDLFLASIQGFIDHESGHLLFTDPLSIVEAQTKKVAQLHNIIEDTYIERKMAEAFKGSPRNLSHMHTIFINRYIEPKYQQWVAEDRSELDFWNLLVACAFRAWCGQEAFVEYMADKWDHIANVTAKLGDLTNEVGSLNSSWEALEYAMKVKKALYGDPSSSSHDPSDSDDEDMGDDDSSPSDMSDEMDDSSPSDSDDQDSGDSSEETEDSGDSSDDASDPGDDDQGADDQDYDGDSDGSEDSEGDSDDPDMGEDSIDDGSDDTGKNPDDGTAPDSDSPGDTETDDDSEDADDPLFDEAEQENLKDFDSSVEDVIENLTNAEHSNSEYLPFSTEADVIETVDPKKCRVSPADVERLEEGMAELIRPMTRSMERIFVAKNKARWETGKRSGRLNTFGLSRLLTEDDRVFRKLEEIKTKAVAVQLVVDCSGSMAARVGRYTRIELAAKTALAFSEVLSRLKINHEVIGYTTSDIWDDQKYLDVVRSQYDYSRYHRAMPLHTLVFKDFNENFSNEVKARLAAVSTRKTALQENVDGESILLCAKRLLRQREPGKAMIVLSDGSPSCCYSDTSKLNKHLKDSVKAVEKAGVDVIAFGIMTDEPKHYYDKFVEVNDLQSLPTKVISQLRSIVTQN